MQSGLGWQGVKNEMKEMEEERDRRPRGGEGEHQAEEETRGGKDRVPICILTPKGVLLLAQCDANATREGH